MAEPVTFVGLATGLLGFQFALWNGVIKLQDRIDIWRHHGQRLLLLASSLNIAIQKLQCWGRTWQLFSERRVTFAKIEAYWGEAGVAELTAIAHGVSERIKTVRHDLKKTHKLDVSQRGLDGCGVNRVTAPPLPKNFDTMAKRSMPLFGPGAFAVTTATLPALDGSMPVRSNFMAKLKGVVGQDDLIARHVEEIKTLVDNLIETSDRTFRARARLDLEDGLKDAKERVQHKQNLMELTKRSRQAAKDMIESLSRALRGISIDVHLDRDTSHADRLNELLAFTLHHQGSMPLDMHLTRPIASIDLASRQSVCVQGRVYSASEWAQQETRFGGAGEVSNPEDLLEKLEDPNSTTAGIQWVGGHFTSAFTLLDQCPTRTGALTTLTELLRAGRSLSSVERVQLLYEIAETAMICMPSQWMSAVCTCHIGLIHPTDSRLPSFFARTSQGVEHKILYGRPIGTTPWCKEPLADRPLCRLGILLTIIAINDLPDEFLPLTDGRMADADYRIVRHSRGEGWHAHSVAIRAANYSDGLADAVEYCLRTYFNADNPTMRDIELFYENVVLPLFADYKAQLIDPQLKGQRTTKKRSRTEGLQKDGVSGA